MPLSPPIKIKQSFNPPILDYAIGKGVKKALDTAALEMTEYLQDFSPRGISPINQSLKGGWDINPARKVRNFIEYEVAVVNVTENALLRLNGRGPGKFPPYDDDSPLALWAKSKGIPPFLVARKIAQEGTERWKQGGKRSAIGLDPLTPWGATAIYIFKRTLEKELREIL